MGIGHLSLIDGDRVCMENLHRQILYTPADLGFSKADVAATQLRALNPEINVHAIDAWLDAGNARTLLSGFDVVLDGTDRLATRALIADATALLGVPLVSAALSATQAQITVLNFGPESRHLRDLHADLSEEPKNCAESGVLPHLPGIAASLQVGEMLKILTGRGDVLAGEVLLWDVDQNRVHRLAFSKSHAPRPLSWEEFAHWHRELEIDFDPRLRATFIDVREKNEPESHAPFVRIPLSRLHEEQLPDGALVFACQTGRRSLALTKKLAAHREVYSLRGGFDHWRSP
jgi:adenylyltransferase/sulfurtransferase